MRPGEEILVLQEHSRHEDFVRIAKNAGWIHIETIQGDGERKSYKDVWKTADMVNSIHYVDDPLMLCRFIWIQGGDIQDALSHTANRLPYWEHDELLEIASEVETIDEGVEAVLQLAVAFPSYNEEVFDVFLKFLNAKNVNLRKATIQAIAYRCWVESIPLLLEVSAEDDDESVRDFARNVLRNSTIHGSIQL